MTPQERHARAVQKVEAKVEQQEDLVVGGWAPTILILLTHLLDTLKAHGPEPCDECGEDSHTACSCSVSYFDKCPDAERAIKAAEEL